MILKHIKIYDIWLFLYDKNMFNPGIEPGTVCVLGRRDNHYTN